MFGVCALWVDVCGLLVVACCLWFAVCGLLGTDVACGGHADGQAPRLRKRTAAGIEPMR